MDRSLGVDAARVLLWVYGVFVVAACSRSVVQFALHASQAPLAYALSGLAAVVYAGGFVLVRRAARGGTRRAARAWAAGELVAVLVVGTISVVDPTAFPDATVWSDYGAGYLGAPLLLPIAVLVWASATYPKDRSTCTTSRRGTGAIVAIDSGE